MKNWIYWLLAFIITIGAAIYQRKTGPTYPAVAKFNVEGKIYSIKFIRSHGGEGDATVELELPDGFSGTISYRHYPSNETFKTIKLERKDGKLIAKLPHQPPAGKLEYFAKISYKGKEVFNNDNKPVRIRFKGEVPTFVLLLHILFMFSAMLFSTYTGLLAIFKDERQRKFVFVTFIILFVGGAIFGPIVQKFAFGQFWTGIPFGWDLTDNKTLIALIFWLIAVLTNIKKQRPLWTILAAVVLLVIFSIPHSMFGSQLDYSTGQVTQGMILFLF